VLDGLGYDPQQKIKIKESQVILRPAFSEDSDSYNPHELASIRKAIEKELRLEVITRQGPPPPRTDVMWREEVADIVVPLLINVVSRLRLKTRGLI